MIRNEAPSVRSLIVTTGTAASSSGDPTVPAPADPRPLQPAPDVPDPVPNPPGTDVPSPDDAPEPRAGAVGVTG